MLLILSVLPHTVSTSPTNMGKDAKDRSLWQTLEGPVSVVVYVLSSLVMTTFNKHAVSVWKFPGGNSLLLAECVCTAVALFAVSPGRYEPFSGQILRYLPLCTAAKAANMSLSFLAMRYTSIPVYNVLKRLNPVFALLTDRMIRGKSAGLHKTAGILCIAAGAIVTGTGDLDFDLLGYAVGILAAISQACYLVLAKNSTDNNPQLTQLDLLFYTAFFNSFIFVVLSVPEFQAVSSFFAENQASGQMWTVFPGYVVLGATLNYSTFWCTTVNSPVTTGVSGNLKGILSTCVGLLLYGVRMTPIGWVGLVLNTVGGFIYSMTGILWGPKKEKKSN